MVERYVDGGKAGVPASYGIRHMPARDRRASSCIFGCFVLNKNAETDQNEEEVYLS